MANRFLVSVPDAMEEPLWLERVEPFLQKAMQKLQFNGEDISVVFCNNSYIRSLNNRYRKIDAETDVLSFEDGDEYEEDGQKWIEAGDIVINSDMIDENARAFNTTTDDELKRLLVHGILHLNGMDHGEEHLDGKSKPKCKMLVLQEDVLDELQNEKITDL